MLILTRVGIIFDPILHLANAQCKIWTYIMLIHVKMGREHAMKELFLKLREKMNTNPQWLLDLFQNSFQFQFYFGHNICTFLHPQYWHTLLSRTDYQQTHLIFPTTYYEESIIPRLHAFPKKLTKLETGQIEFYISFRSILQKILCTDVFQFLQLEHLKKGIVQPQSLGNKYVQSIWSSVYFIDIQYYHWFESRKHISCKRALPCLIYHTNKRGSKCVCSCLYYSIGC